MFVDMWKLYTVGLAWVTSLVILSSFAYYSGYDHGDRKRRRRTLRF